MSRGRWRGICSHALFTVAFLVFFLLQLVCFFALNDLVSFDLQVHVHALVVLVIIFNVTKGILLMSRCSTVSITSSVIVHVSVDARLRAHTNVLVDEVISGEVSHEVLRRDEASILVVLLVDDLLELLGNRMLNLLKAERNSLVVVGANVLVELLVNLLDHATAPCFHLLVDQLHFVVYSLDLFLLARALNCLLI